MATTVTGPPDGVSPREPEEQANGARTREPTERAFAVSGLTIAGREWGRPDELSVLAAHGWLDNAGSFDLLAPLLTGCRLLALDAAGHGLSDFRSPDSGYNLWQEVGDLVEVADQLGWETFRVIAHSRGAAVATLLAGTYPERVEQLVLIEGGLPLIGKAEEAPETLATALRQKRDLAKRQGRVFPDLRTAVEERVAGFSPVSFAAAEVLARRSVRPVDGGYRWHSDQRLKARSELQLTARHVRAFVQRINASVLMFCAEESPFARWPEYEEMIPLFRRIDVVRLPGGHHLHMEGAEHEIAVRTRRFFGLGEPPG
jgi:pimeloyl-ACP methyl ester carboxylesterase